MNDDIAGSEQIAWVLETKIKAGERPAVEALIKEAVEATQTEPGAINYEFFMGGDVLHVYEKYADSAATASHLTWFNDTIAERFLASAEVTRLTVYGSPDDGVREVLDSMGATYQDAYAGFAR